MSLYVFIYLSTDVDKRGFKINLNIKIATNYSQIKLSACTLYCVVLSDFLGIHWQTLVWHHLVVVEVSVDGEAIASNFPLVAR